MKEGLKQRLIGAFVLAALGVIFLPGFFKEQRTQHLDTRTRIPPSPSIETIEFAVPEPDPVVEPAPSPATMFLPEEEAVAAEPSPVEAASASSASSSVLPAVPEMPLNAQGLPDAWIIQVASLSNQEAALRLRDRLQAEGHKAFVREGKTDRGTFHRVFIGPKVDRAEALAIKARVDAQFNVNAQVRRFEP